MKWNLFFLCSLMVFSANSQKENQQNDLGAIFAYITYDDFLQNKSQKLGYYGGYQINSASFGIGNKTSLFINNGPDSKESKKVSMNKFWGFKINNYLFRITKQKQPLTVIKKDAKIFYMMAEPFFDEVANKADEDKTHWVMRGVLYYSDKLNSKIYSLKKLKKDKSPELKTLNKCIKLANKRKSHQSIFDARLACIMQ